MLLSKQINCTVDVHQKRRKKHLATLFDWKLRINNRNRTVDKCVAWYVTEKFATVFFLLSEDDFS